MVGDLVDGYEPDPKGPGCSGLFTFVSRGDAPEAMEVATSVSIDLPLTFVCRHIAALAEYAVVVDNQRLGTNIERHFVRAVDVVGVLDQFVCEASITGEAAQVRAKFTKIVDVSRKESWWGHQLLLSGTDGLQTDATRKCWGDRPERDVQRGSSVFWSVSYRVLVAGA